MKRKFGRLEIDKIHLQRVTIVSAFIENPLEISAREVEGFNFSLGFTLGFNPEDQMAKAELEVNLSTALENAASQATAKFRLAFIYSLDNFDDLIHLDNTKVEVSDELAIAIASISYSTARGILLTRFQGTLFREFILPVISPLKILNAQPIEEEEG
jgi:hypothetical protein